jgi:hypothetical protein
VDEVLVEYKTMKFPLVSLSRYELVVRLLDTQQALIDTLRKQNEELKALFNKASNFDIIDNEEGVLQLKLKPVAPPTVSLQNGRAGFRARVTAGEARTKPQPADSVAALEKRVAEQKAARGA